MLATFLSVHHFYHSNGIASGIFHTCGDMFTHSCVGTVNHHSLPEIWCPAWCCFLQEEGERRKSKTGHLQICQGSSSSPPLCPWGEKHQRKRSGCPFIPPSLPRPCSALCGTCAPLEYSSFPPWHWIKWHLHPRPTFAPHELQNCRICTFFFFLHTRTQNCLTYCE